MSTLTSSLIVSLINKVTAPARAIAGSLGDLQARARRNAAQLGAMRGRMIDAAAAGYALAHAVAAPVKAAANFQTAIEDIGQKIGKTRSELVGLGTDARKVGLETGQGAMKILEAIDNLVGRGASENAAVAMAKPIGKAATAYAASTDDLSSAVFAAHDNLKVPAGEISRVLDVMAAAGKEGAFELKDMASEFPALTAAAQALGIKGVSGVSDLVAALEVARKGAASGSQAANNMANFMQKIVSKETIKNMKKFGVDVPKELAKAAKTGISPIEHMLGVIDEITDGGRAEKIAQLFGDKQVVEFLRPMLANMEEYRRIRKSALEATGVVDTDFARRMETVSAKATTLVNRLQDMAIGIGLALAPATAATLDALNKIVAVISRFVESNKELAAGLISLVSGLVALKIATTAARWGYLFLKGGILDVGIAAAKTAKGVVAAGARMRAAFVGASMLSAIGGGGLIASATAAAAQVGTIAAGIGATVAGITAPVWGTIALVVAGIALVAAAIHRYWEPISNFVAGFAGEIAGALGEAWTAFSGFAGQMASAVGEWADQKLMDFGEWLGIDPATMRAALDFAYTHITEAFSRIVEFVKSIPSTIGNWVSDLFAVKDYTSQEEAAFRESGAALARAMIDGLKSLASDIASWGAALGGTIAEAIRSGIGSLFEAGRKLLLSFWNGLKSVAADIIAWANSIVDDIKAPFKAASKFISSVAGSIGLGSSEAVDGARAAGGPIVGGRTYLVGEEGPEMVTPSRNGYVHDADSTADMLGGNRSPSSTSDAAPAIPGRLVSMSFGDIVINNPQDADDVVEQLEDRLRERLSGVFADTGWSAA